MKKSLKYFALLTVLSYTVVSCGNHEAKEENSHDEMHDEMHEEHADHDHAAMEESAAESEELSVPEGANVYFVNLKEGQTVSSPIKIEFGVNGMEVEPAGELHQGMGHHHLIIDGSALAKGVVVPADSVNIHYGKGQTETEIELSSGEHTLTMQFADGYHQSYGEQMSTTIKVMVK